MNLVRDLLTMKQRITLPISAIDNVFNNLINSLQLNLTQSTIPQQSKFRVL